MEWVLDPVDDVELVPDIERVRSVGTVKKKTIEFHKMSLSPFYVANLIHTRKQIRDHLPTPALALFRTKLIVKGKMSYYFISFVAYFKKFLSFLLHRYFMNHLLYTFNWLSSSVVKGPALCPTCSNTTKTPHCVTNKTCKIGVLPSPRP